MYGYGYRYAGSGSGKVAGLDPVVQTFADNNGITSTKEINALNALYLFSNGFISNHGSGGVYCCYGVSPTSYAASLEVIIAGAGNSTVGVGGTAPTHSNDGLEFNGVNNYIDLGPIQNNKPQNEILVAYSRTNTISSNGVSCGVNHGGTVQCSFRGTPNTSGYINGNQYTTGQNFGIPGNYIGYNDGVNYAIWKDGIKQTPDVPKAISTALTGSNNFFFGARNQLGSPSNYVDERLGLFLMFWDGGNLFSDAQVKEIDQAMFNYNANVV